MSDPFQTMHLDVFARLGQSATYHPVSGDSVATQVIVEDAPQGLGIEEDGATITRTRRVIKLLKEQIPNPQKHDRIVLGDGSWDVVRVVEEQRSIIMVEVQNG